MEKIKENKNFSIIKELFIFHSSMPAHSKKSQMALPFQQGINTCCEKSLLVLIVPASSE